MRQIEIRSKEEPYIGAKIGSEEIWHRLLNAMKDAKGVHLESILCALAAMAGYSCQAALRALAQNSGLPETNGLSVVETHDGQQFFFGDPLNNMLFGGRMAPCNLAAGMAQQCGCTEFPNMHDVFGYVTSTVGKASFGIPRLPEGHRPGDSPINYLRALWIPLHPVVMMFCPKPSHWPVLYGLALQKGIDHGKAALDPAIALKLIIECAAPMSKVDLGAALSAEN